MIKFFIFISILLSSYFVNAEELSYSDNRFKLDIMYGYSGNNKKEMLAFNVNKDILKSKQIYIGGITGFDNYIEKSNNYIIGVYFKYNIYNNFNTNLYITKNHQLINKKNNNRVGYSISISNYLYNVKERNNAIVSWKLKYKYIGDNINNSNSDNILYFGLNVEL